MSASENALISITDLMHDLKLTHGGFYRHFNSKEQLFAETLGSAMQDAHAKLTTGSDAKTPTAQLRVIIELYLSPWHCANPAEGCPPRSLGFGNAASTPTRTKCVRSGIRNLYEWNGEAITGKDPVGEATQLSRFVFGYGRNPEPSPSCVRRTDTGQAVTRCEGVLHSRVLSSPKPPTGAHRTDDRLFNLLGVHALATDHRADHGIGIRRRVISIKMRHLHIQRRTAGHGQRHNRIDLFRGFFFGNPEPA